MNVFLLALLLFAIPTSHAFLTPHGFEATKKSTLRQSQRDGVTEMNDSQRDFFMGYINQHHSDLLTEFTLAFTELGPLTRRKNAFSGGSFSVKDARMIDVSRDSFVVEVDIHERNKPVTKQNMSILFNADLAADTPSRSYRLQPKINIHSENIVDDSIRRLIRLCHIVKYPEVTGKLVQLGIQIGGEGKARIEENLYLNNVPHPRAVRNYFYEMACKATLNAVIQCSKGELTNRMQLCCLFPELNPNMDAYRIGTLLEMTRSLAITLAEQNLRVRVCVQGSMGVGIFTAIPKQLSGVATLFQRMDWQSGPGEENEGMVGNYVNFGGIGKEHVVNSGIDSKGNKVEQDDVFIIVCPQSMVGTDTSIYGPLFEHVEAAGDRPVILINPDLSDKVSAAGQQSVRGRSERIAFQNSFETIYHFQCTYVSGTSYFPILGALGRFGADQPWVAYQRRDRVNNGGEVYIPVICDEQRPDGEAIMKSMDM